MNPRRWRRVQEVFDRALELDPDDRAAYLDRATAADAELRREVLSLIHSLEQASRFIETPVMGEVTTENLLPGGRSGSSPRRFEPGMRLGAYRLVRLLGAGGAGQVFLAVRADDAYEQNVAIKVIKRGMDTDELVRRFLGERQILARLEHPNIAKLLDGGATEDGRPYLVMEHVDGEPIDRWCHRTGADLRTRIELFCLVCEAVQFAHRNLIVHRDLKPGNILVSNEGVPKLLDFGIAKLLDPETFPGTILPTAPGWRPMTPEYASPEQVQGKAITTASDVYSLGVVLFELLVGQRPLVFSERTPSAVERVVCHQPPPRASKLVTESPARRLPAEPRRLARQLTGDLDDILAMALEKEADRRYASVGQLSNDLRRYLDGLPVRARKGTFFYRASKLVARHRWAATAAVLVFLLSLSFSAALLVQRADILRQRDRAEATTSLLMDIFTVSDPSRERGETVTARELLDKAARDTAPRLRDRPGLLGDFLGTIGTTYTRLGLYDEARPLLERSLALRRQAYGPSHQAVGEAHGQLAELDIATDRLAEAEAHSERALLVHAREQGEGHRLVVESLFRLARVREQQGEPQEAGRLFRSAEKQARELGPDELLIRVLSGHGLFANYVDDVDEARRLLAEALALAEGLWGEIHPQTASILGSLAQVERPRNPPLAGEYLQRALRIQKSVYRDQPHPDTARTLTGLAVLHEQQGELERAETRYRETLAMLDRVYGGPSHLGALAQNGLASTLVSQGRYEEAEEIYRRSLEHHRNLLGERHENTATVLNNLGDLFLITGRLDEAERFFEEAVDILEDAYGEGHSRVAVARNNLGHVAFDRGDYAAARDVFAEADRRLAALSPTHPERPLALQNQAHATRRLDDAPAAIALYRQALEILDANGAGEGPEAATVYYNLAVALVTAKRPDEAAVAVLETIEIYARLHGEGSPDWLHARRILANVLQRQDRDDEAVSLAEENLALCRENVADGSEEEKERACARHASTLEKLVASRERDRQNAS